MLAAAYVPRAQFRCVVLWRPAGSRLPVSVDVLFSLRKMRRERAKMAIFLWLAPRPALAGSSLIGGRRAREGTGRARAFLILLFLISHGSDTLFHFLSRCPGSCPARRVFPDHVMSLQARMLPFVPPVPGSPVGRGLGTCFRISPQSAISDDVSRALCVDCLIPRPGLLVFRHDVQ